VRPGALLKPIGLGALAALFAAAPFFLPNYHLHTLVIAGLFVMLTSGLNLIHGYVGRLSLGHTAFYGLGGYAAALVATKLGGGLLLSLPAAALVTLVGGLAIGHITLRFRGAHFVLVTLAFAAILQLLANNWVDLTGGPMGMSGVSSPLLHQDFGAWHVFGSRRSFYWLVLGLDVATIYLVWRLVTSPAGDAMIALREDENLAEAVGVSGYKYSMLAFIAGAVLAGIAGAIYAHYVTFVSPELFRFETMISILVMVIIGSVGTVSGPVLGALIVTVLLETLRLQETLREPLFGAVLVAATLLFPKGLVVLVAERLRAGAGRRAAPPPAPAVQEDVSAAPAPPLRLGRERLLEVEGLSVRFGGLVAVDALDFVVHRGEILSLIGPNGAGKTTTLNLVTGFVARSAGTIRFKGEEIAPGAPPYAVASRGVIRTFQTTRGLMDISIGQALRIGLHRTRPTGWRRILFGISAAETARTGQRVAALLARVGLARDPEELTRNLSYGEQRLLEIAIALAAEPELLILDEPAAGMNPEETLRMMALIREVRDSGVTVLLVEHDMKLVMGLSDRIVVLDHGRRIAEGAPAQIRQNPEVITAYLGRGAAHAAA
jgi:branched-chain amino acid transport system permease protein